MFRTPAFVTLLIFTIGNIEPDGNVPEKDTGAAPLMDTVSVPEARTKRNVIQAVPAATPVSDAELLPFMNQFALRVES